MKRAIVPLIFDIINTTIRHHRLYVKSEHRRAVVRTVQALRADRSAAITAAMRLLQFYSRPDTE